MFMLYLIFIYSKNKKSNLFIHNIAFAILILNDLCNCNYGTYIMVQYKLIQF